MSPQTRYWLQTLGAFWLGLTSLFFALRDAPFVWGVLPEGAEGFSSVRMTSKDFQNLATLPSEPEHGYHVVRFAPPAEASDAREGEGRVSAERYAQIAVGDSLPAAHVWGRWVLAEDPRWGVQGRKTGLAWAAVALLFLCEGTRRLAVLAYRRYPAFLTAPVRNAPEGPK